MGRMNDLVWERQPEVRQRVLVAAFAGYFDAASASTGAIDWLIEHSGATRLAHIEPDDFFDFQQLRPQVVLEDGVTRQIVWPENIVHVTEHLGSDRDLVMLSGIEPHVHWRQFCAVLLDIADRASCEMVVTLGATPAQVGLAWLLARADNILLIPGTSSLAHLEENLAVRDLVLSAADQAELVDR